jgi:hypothetical protein
MFSLLIVTIGSNQALAETILDLSEVRKDIMAYIQTLHVDGQPYGCYSLKAGGKPDFYATCDVALMRTIMAEDLIKSLSPKQRTEWIDQINSFARPDGVYQSGRHSRLHRNGMAIGALGAIGGQQKYPVQLYEAFDSIDEVVPWLKSINWSRQWGASHLFWGGMHCYSMSRKCTPEWRNTVFKWLDQNLDPKSGWWRKGVKHSDKNQPLGGGAHIWPFYQHHRRPFPYPKQVIDSILTMQNQDGAWLGFGNYLDLDALYGLAYMRSLAPKHRTKDIRQAVKKHGHLVCREYPHLMAQKPDAHQLLAMVGDLGLLNQLDPQRFHDKVKWTDIFSDNSLYNTKSVECLKPAIKNLSNVNSIGQARLHPIVYNRPAPNFFEGAVLGNGGLGAIVTTRPDAVVIYFGHNDVWDIRIAENNREKIGTFQEIFEKIKSVPNTVNSLYRFEWYKEYLKVCNENYSKPYPRPFPCGSVAFWFDRREAELLGHSLSIDSGVCKVDFLIDNKIVRLELFVDMEADRLWARMIDRTGKPIKAPFNYIAIMPDPDTPKEFPPYSAAKHNNQGTISFRQTLPFKEITQDKPYSRHPEDKAIVLTTRVNSTFDDNFTIVTGGASRKMGRREAGIKPNLGFVMCIQLDNGKASSINLDHVNIPPPSGKSYHTAAEKSREAWKKFWGKSGIAVDDKILERTWYWNLYFLRCALRPGVTCPGLFANWSYRKIGSSWHGDYHLNYNLEQPFWVTFSSNHPHLHLPYVDMIEHILLPVCKKWTKEYYNMRGAAFPLVAFPVQMNMWPYTTPHLGWEICITPWAVQSLWWHYSYTSDKQFLKDRAFGIIKEAVLFLVDYIKRPDTRGQQWGDDNYHIYPSVPPELYGLLPGFDKNVDLITDLTMTRFVFNAYLEACDILDLEEKENYLISDVKDILTHFPDYPKTQSKYGEVFVSVKGEHPDTVYNVPISLMTVFPGEHHGLHSPPDQYKIAANTYRSQQNEGGNELVFLNLQAARLGLLDIEKFKRQIDYCLMPNGTCADKVLQIHGRYSNTTKFDYMAEMGIMFENFALPAVINECMLQGYNGRLRFFPNWPKDKDAEFKSLRTVGAFLVSAKHSQGQVKWIEILSEAGQTANIINPWKTKVRCISSTGEKILTGDNFTIKTKPGELLQLKPHR